MKQTKSMQVPVEAESSKIEVWRCFGWELFSTQEVRDTDSHLENRGGTIYSVTNTTHYIKLTFQRDDRMPGINELNAAQRKYENAVAAYTPLKPFSFALFVIGLVVPYMVLHIMGNSKRKKNNVAQLAAMEEAKAEGIKIIREHEEQ